MDNTLIRLAMTVLLLTVLSSSWLLSYRRPSILLHKRLPCLDSHNSYLQLSTQDDEKFSGTEDKIFDEIKAELDLLGIDYSDLDDSARAEFAKRLIDAQLKLRSDDSDRLQIPGGLDEMTKSMLLKDPEVISLLESPKMQEMMMAVLNDDTENFMKENPDTMKAVTRLSSIISKVTGDEMPDDSDFDDYSDSDNYEDDSNTD